MEKAPISWLMQFKFWLLFILSIPSALCSLFIIIHFYRKPKDLTPYHYLTIVLIVTSFLQVTTELPFAIAYYRRGQVIPASSAFCTWWNWWAFALQGILRFAMAWGSIERHFLVFNSSTIATRQKRLAYHVLPMLVACVYAPIFHFGAIVVNSCEKTWNFSMVMCDRPCYLTAQSSVATYDFMINIVLPILVITAANISLIVRVVWQKQGHSSSWHRQRKLTIQLLCIAIVYTLFWFPMAFNGLFLLFWFSNTCILMQMQADYFLFVLCMVAILLPFISLATLPTLTRTWCNERLRVMMRSSNIAQAPFTR